VYKFGVYKIHGTHVLQSKNANFVLFKWHLKQLASAALADDMMVMRLRPTSKRLAFSTPISHVPGGSIAEWLACWTQAQKARVQVAVATLSSNSLRQTVHTHRASVHQAAKLVAALLRVAEVTEGLAESNGSLPPGL